MTATATAADAAAAAAVGEAPSLPGLILTGKEKIDAMAKQRVRNINRAMAKAATSANGISSTNDGEGRRINGRQNSDGGRRWKPRKWSSRV